MTLNNTLNLRLATKGCIFSLASLHQVMHLLWLQFDHVTIFDFLHFLAVCGESPNSATVAVGSFSRGQLIAATA